VVTSHLPEAVNALTLPEKQNFRGGELTPHLQDICTKNNFRRQKARNRQRKQRCQSKGKGRRQIESRKTPVTSQQITSAKKRAKNPKLKGPRLQRELPVIGHQRNRGKKEKKKTAALRTERRSKINKKKGLQIRRSSELEISFQKRKKKKGRGTRKPQSASARGKRQERKVNGGEQCCDTDEKDEKKEKKAMKKEPQRPGDPLSGDENCDKTDREGTKGEDRH